MSDRQEKAQWVWHSAAAVGPGLAVTIVARRAFELASAHRCATIRISANQIYRLHINGQRVSRGPDRADPRFPYIDAYDVTSLLHTGVNVLLVEARFAQPAVGSNFVCLAGGEPGLLVELSVDDRLIVTDTNWKTRIAPGWEAPAQVYTSALGPKPVVDLQASQQLLPMHQPSYDDSSWLAAIERPTNADGSIRPEPLPRETPPLTPVLRRPLAVGRVQPEADVVAGSAALLGYVTQVPTIVHPSPEGAWITVDLGRSMGGFPIVELESQGGRGWVDLYFGEGGAMTMGDRLRLSPHEMSSYEGLDWRGCRFISLHFRELQTAVRVHTIALLEMVYPFEPRGDFLCSDEALTAVWRTCRQTAWSGTKDHPVDCVGREQALWLDDLRVHGRVMAACFGDTRPASKGVRQALRVMGDDGVVPVPGPAGVGYNLSGPELMWSCQPLTLPMTLLDLYQYDGDTQLLRWAIPALKKMFTHFASYENESGLLRVAPAQRRALVPFAGWNPAWDRGCPSGLTFRYILSLRCAARLARVVGENDLSTHWQSQADTIAAAAHQAFWDAQRHLFTDGLDDDRQPVRVFSPTQNAWGALAGVLKTDDVGAWAHAIRSDISLEPLSPFDAGVLLEALLSVGLHLHARELLDRYFASIIRAGHATLPEFWSASIGSGWRSRDDDSRCHPYGCIPACLLHRYVLGAAAIEPGWRLARLQPTSLGLTFAQGRVPTPRGTLGVRWERSDTSWSVELSIPSGMDVDLVLARLGLAHHRLLIDQVVVREESGWHVLNELNHRRPAPSASQPITHTLAGGRAYSVRLETY